MALAVVSGCTALQDFWPFNAVEPRTEPVPESRPTSAGPVPVAGSSMAELGERVAVDAERAGGSGDPYRVDRYGGAVGVDDEQVDPPGRKARRRAARQLDRNLNLVELFHDKGLAAHTSEEGVVVTLSDEVFEFGSSELTDEAGRKLGTIADMILGEARGRRAVVGGHTDAIGAELYNVGLSKRRAKSVADALVDRGVAPALLTATGFGSAQPIAPNRNPDGSDNPHGRVLNRRVEIVILN